MENPLLDNEYNPPFQGATLLDYFAGKAMLPLVQLAVDAVKEAGGETTEEMETGGEQLPDLAYHFAEMMLQERAKRMGLLLK